MDWEGCSTTWAGGQDLPDCWIGSLGLTGETTGWGRRGGFTRHVSVRFGPEGV